MKNRPFNDNYQKTLSFSPFSSGADVDAGDASVLGMTGVRLLSKSLRITASSRTADQEAATPRVEQSVVSPYHVDDYGRPRTLSKLEVILHTLAWPAVAGVVIGFGLAIALLAVHNASILQPQEKAGQLLVRSQEASP